MSMTAIWKCSSNSNMAVKYLLERFPQCCGIIINRCSPQREQGPLADTQEWFGPCLRCGLTKMIAVLEHRGNRSINSTAVDGTECGGIVFKPGDRIEVVPWTKSELFRGLETGTAARLAPVPANTGDIKIIART